MVVLLLLLPAAFPLINRVRGGFHTGGPPEFAIPGSLSAIISSSAGGRGEEKKIDREKSTLRLSAFLLALTLSLERKKNHNARDDLVCDRCLSSFHYFHFS